MLLRRVAPVAALLLSVRVLPACSSSAGPPAARDNSPTDGGSNTKEDELVGEWSCYPEPGDYLVHYTKKPESTPSCPDERDTDTKVVDLKGPLPKYPNCTTTGDRETCTVVSICQHASVYASINENTTTVYARGQVPPVKGVRRIVTGMVVDGGPSTTECVYEFVYSKK
jgi:hypothetical protein